MTREATVLIAEDSPTQAAQITFLLTEHGYNVVRARNGREALDLLRQNLPDILISDVVMPEMNGYDLCRAVKSDPVTARLPVILVTGLSSPQDVFKGLNAGADNFVTKPYDESNLVSRIDYLLANQKIRAGENLRSGIEIELNGQRHFITAERQQILDLLISLQRDSGMGLVLITHDMGVVAETAQRVVVMYAGQIVEAHSAERLFNQPRHPYTQALLDALPERSLGRSRLPTLPGVVPGAHDRPDGCLFNPRCRYRSAICMSDPPALADDSVGRETGKIRCHFPLQPVEASA